MHYPYPELVFQLQFLCTPEKYQSLIQPVLQPTTGGYGIPYGIEAYWQIIPEYLYARCPICSMEYREPADTYNFGSWGGYHILRSGLFIVAETYEKYVTPLSRCSHFLGVTEFINLHNQPLAGFDSWHNWTGEVPFITETFLPDDIESYAILHALPVCRMTNGEFVPSYTVFVITYFSKEPQALEKRGYEKEWQRGKDDPEFFPSLLSPPGTRPNLVEYTAKGRLGWLDFESSDLPLRLGKNEKLPEIYSHISGKAQPYTWKRTD